MGKGSDSKGRDVGPGAGRGWQFLLGLALCGLAGWAQAQALAGLRILPHAGADTRFPGWQAEAAQLPARVPLELGDSVDGAVLELLPASPGGQWRVSVQYETSLSLGADGPHLDLVDWKHCVSAWIPATPRDAHSFILPVATPEQASCFPPYSQAELEAAIRAHVPEGMGPEYAQGWLQRLRAHLSGTEPMHLEPGISRVRIRVERLHQGRWEDVARVDFLPPMGC